MSLQRTPANVWRSLMPLFNALALPRLNRKSLSCCALAALLLPTLSAHAQNAPAADADAASPALSYPTLPLPPLASDTPGSADWRKVHEDVGAFPRGHVDIVLWEAQQQNALPAKGNAQPHQNKHHHHHSGGKP